MAPSAAFVSELSHQMELARREQALAHSAGDDVAAQVAADRIADLDELLRRTTAATSLEEALLC